MILKRVKQKKEENFKCTGCIFRHQEISCLKAEGFNLSCVNVKDASEDYIFILVEEEKK